MARMFVFDEYLQQRNSISSRQARDRVDNLLRLIEEVPGVGSALVRDSVKSAYGPNVLKALAGPYQIIYEYDRKGDVVYVYGLLYGPSVA